MEPHNQVPEDNPDLHGVGVWAFLEEMHARRMHLARADWRSANGV